MKYGLNISRPDIIFAATWLMVLAVYVPLPTIMSPPLGADVWAMLGFNILSGPIIYYLVRKAIEYRHGKRPVIARPAVTALDEKLINEFMGFLIAVWATIFIANVFYSGGVPLLWYLTGDRREYLDFGMLSISGFGDMFRCFAACLCLLLLVSTHRRIYALLWLLHALPPLLQVSRGGVSIFVCQSIAMFLLLQKVSWRQLLTGGVILLFAGGSFIALGSLRGITMQSSDFADVNQFFNGVPVGFYWMWTYVASPLGNVAFQASLHMPVNYIPHKTLVYLLPSIVRGALFSGDFYTPLIIQSLNAASIYAPLISDFGIVGATIAITILLIVASFVHVHAQRGNLFYMLMYPCLFAALALSFFHIFALTPGVVLVPVLCLGFRRFLKKKYALIRQIGPGRLSAQLRPMMPG